MEKAGSKWTPILDAGATIKALNRTEWSQNWDPGIPSLSPVRPTRAQVLGLSSATYPDTLERDGLKGEQPELELEVIWNPNFSGSDATQCYKCFLQYNFLLICFSSIWKAEKRRKISHPQTYFSSVNHSHGWNKPKSGVPISIQVSHLVGDSSSWAFMCCLPWCIIKQPDGKWSSQVTS